MGREQLSRREFLAGLAAGAGIAAAGTGVAREAKRLLQDKPLEAQTSSKDEYVPVEAHDFFDKNEEFLKPLTPEDGEWTKEQRVQRRRKLDGGEEIFDDVGLSFYLVHKGDTLSEIRERLSAYPEFAYLASQKGKLDSFNIPERKLRADMWIPIPVEAKDRQLSEAQFTQYAVNAIEEMREDEVYGGDVVSILDKAGQRTLVATMIAIAKQEAGGEPIGRFALHRWEDHQKAFSFSYFHVLMKGPGLDARRKLNLTEGQVYHPQNAVKLLLAFIIEKSRESGKRADRLFPILENEEAFAQFYNGKRWKTINPNYIKNLRRFFREADGHLSEDGRRWKMKKTILTHRGEEKTDG